MLQMIRSKEHNIIVRVDCKSLYTKCPGVGGWVGFGCHIVTLVKRLISQLLTVIAVRMYNTNCSYFSTSPEQLYVNLP